jgi:hypothetical protein
VEAPSDANTLLVLFIYYMVPDIVGIYGLTFFLRWKLSTMPIFSRSYRPVDSKLKATGDGDLGLVPEFVTNILICTVRVLPGPNETNPHQLPYCFEIISPNRRVYTLQVFSAFTNRRRRR